MPDAVHVILQALDRSWHEQQCSCLAIDHSLFFSALML